MHTHPLSKVVVHLKYSDKFWGKTQYFQKTIGVDNSLNYEEVLNAVKLRYPNFIYFEWKGQIVKNLK